MSSAGRVSAEVIERRRREMEMARERKRRKAVKVRIGELCEEIDSVIAILAETGGAAWVHKEIKGTLEIRESAKDVDEADVDNMLRKVTEARARLSSLQQIAGERRQEKKMAMRLRMLMHRPVRRRRTCNCLMAYLNTSSARFFVTSSCMKSATRSACVTTSRRRRSVH